MSRIRIAVIGAGQFGRNHCRVVNQSERAALAAVVDLDAARAADAARASGAPALTSIEKVAELADAAIVATPTVSHAEVGCRLMEAGLDVLVEKPVAPDLASADRLVETAARCGRVLQVGHLERFNPAVQALAGRVTLPLFFEVHRLSVFSPRSLDIDVVLDLMIHDIDLVLHLTGAEPGRSRRQASPSFPPKWISPTCDWISPTAAWPTSPPRGFPPTACASCGFSSHGSTFPWIMPGRTSPCSP